MALYLGSTKVTPFPSNYCSWFPGENPIFLYEANYNCSLSETNSWASYKSTYSTSNRQIKFNATTYTTSANINVIYDRYGAGYHNGEALDFSKYNYIIVYDALLDMAYTTPEASLGSFHVVRSYRSGMLSIGQIYKFISSKSIPSEAFTLPTTTTAGTTTYGSITYTRQLLRNGSNILTHTDNATYGFYFALAAPAFQNTSALTSNYIDFKTPTLNVRGNASYLTEAAFLAIDENNSQIKIKQRLYKVKKPSLLENIFIKLGNGLMTGNIPTESI